MVIKLLHETCALLTLVSFCLRGAWILQASPRLRQRVTRILPHVIDTVLFLSGLTLAIRWYGAFWREAWLVAKLAAVLIYIVCGMVALRHGHSRPVRAAAFAAALLVFGWIVWVAHTRSIVLPWQWISAS
jgi:uncharacterized membrane protein SirB2